MFAANKYMSSKSRVVKASIYLTLSISYAYASADNVEANTRALKIISEFAESYCSNVEPEGQTKSFILEGRAQAKVNGLISRLADIGIEGAGKFSSEKFQGFLQKDLASAYKTNIECRSKVLETLAERLLTPNSKATDGDSITGNQGNIIKNNQGNVTINY